jgi:hypothetical protein
MRAQRATATARLLQRSLCGAPGSRQLLTMLFNVLTSRASQAWNFEA